MYAFIQNKGMWLSKLIDILGLALYISLLFFGIRLGFKNSFRVLLFILFLTAMNTVIYRIFKSFIVKEYLEFIDTGIVIVSSVVSFFVFYPLISKISDRIGDIGLVVVNRMISFLLFAVNGVFLIGYFVIFSELYPQFYYVLETSSFLRIMSNIVKFVIGIEII